MGKLESLLLFTRYGKNPYLEIADSASLHLLCVWGFQTQMTIFCNIKLLNAKVTIL